MVQYFLSICKDQRRLNNRYPELMAIQHLLFASSNRVGGVGFYASDI